jgi:TRAP-type C4-dicarboxylate transport system substrate-binding protein
VKRLLLILVVTLLISTFVITGCSTPAPEPAPAPAPAPTPAPAPEPAKVKIEFATQGSPADELRVADVNETIAVIMEATNNRADVTVHWGDTLLPPADWNRGLTEGIIDLAHFQPSVTPGVFPLQGIFTLPGLFADQMQSIFTSYEVFHEFPQFADEFGPQIVVLSNYSLMTADIHSTMPIRSLDELKGKTIAGMDEGAVKILNSIGANGIVMPHPDMYVSAERGVIDGALIPWGFIHGEKLYEQLMYHTELNMNPVAFAYVMNREAFEQFTPEEQANLKRSWFALPRPTMSRNVKININQIPTLTGQEFIEFPSEDYAEISKLTAPIVDEWVSAMNDLGYPGREIADFAYRWADGYMKH